MGKLAKKLGALPSNGTGPRAAGASGLLDDDDWNAIAEARARDVAWRQIFEVLPEGLYRNLNSFIASATSRVARILEQRAS